MAFSVFKEPRGWLSDMLVNNSVHVSTQGSWDYPGTFCASGLQMSFLWKYLIQRFAGVASRAVVLRMGSSLGRERWICFPLFILHHLVEIGQNELHWTYLKLTSEQTKKHAKRIRVWLEVQPASNIRSEFKGKHVTCSWMQPNPLRY